LQAAAALLSSKDAEIEQLRYLLWAAEVELQSMKEAEQSRRDAEAHKEPEIKMEKQPLYLSEEQEDIQWQYDNNLIELDQYRSLLRELDFENAEIQLDEDFTVENFHY
jgi:ribosome-interacting GTPase 1